MVPAAPSFLKSGMGMVTSFNSAAPTDSPTAASWFERSSLTEPGGRFEREAKQTALSFVK
jgi:hypothetical protein